MFDDILRKIGEIINEKEERFKNTSPSDINENTNKEEDDENKILTTTNYNEEEDSESEDTLSKLDEILNSIKNTDEESDTEETEDKEDDEDDIKESVGKKFIVKIPKNSKTSSFKYSSFIEYLEDSF